MQAAWPFLLTCVLFWGWTFVATKICLDYMSPIELLGLRLLVGVPALWLVVRVKKIRLDFDRAEWKSIGLGGLIIAVHFLIQITGLKYTSATNTGWIIGVCPLVMAVMAFLILREKLSRAALVGIAVATAGVLLLVSGGNLGKLDWLSSVGDWLILASAHTWALYTIVVRNVTRTRQPLAVTLAVMLPATLISLVYMVFTTDWSRIVAMPLESYLAALFLGLAGTAVAHWFWQEGVARVGASKAGIYLYLEPLATTALAVPLLGESFGFLAAVGGLLVLTGVFLAGRRGRARLRP